MTRGCRSRNPACKRRPGSSVVPRGALDPRVREDDKRLAAREFACALAARAYNPALRGVPLGAERKAERPHAWSDGRVGPVFPCSRLRWIRVEPFRGLEGLSVGREWKQKG